MLFRLLLLLAIAGALGVFALSNWSPVLSLTFLGMATPALPLALWVLGAIAAGILTSVLLTLLFSTSNYLTEREVRSRLRRVARNNEAQTRTPPPPRSTAASSDRTPAPVDDDAAWQNWEGYDEKPQERRSVVEPPPTRGTTDEWESSGDDDWNWVDEDLNNAPEPTISLRSPVGSNSERTEYELNQTPKSESRSGSVYSYSYRDPDGSSGVGRQEKVVDADYRVIIPPYQPTPAEASPKDTSQADDWFEDEGNEFEDEPRRSS